ncbi:GNAT family N-acetyltransferase [Oscillatoria sp. CS-180]|uniref:GNAT family N-acetyltransferase n=1 Tax=Oscillatoria sp. CS-180 TaxID=3021720 RepID=UPI00232D59F5|nr:GNAT family N-acetyltransferase [Oscillatoria sp. CS-180]MDB9527230.1 GNAT family N-acetyltransferase [Oscillatoria sp. CS-180]
MTANLIPTVCTNVGEADLAAIAQLINTCRIADNLETRTSVEKLREDFSDPTFDINQDLRLWRREDGELIAVAEFWRLIPEQEFVCILSFDIHPQARDGDLAQAILDWAEKRLVEVGGASGLPLVLHSSCRDSVEVQRSLLLELGFQPERYFLKLKRSLETSLPKTTLPDGWQIRPVTANDAQAWVDMFNETFVDHWNHHPTTVKEFLHEMTRSDYDANLDLVVETPDGQMAAFCYSEIDPERNNRLGIQEGYVCLLGTRRGFRRRGLARTMLVESLRRLQLVGMELATIGVDAQNPLGALKLYESVGFEREHSSTVFQKQVDRV